MLKNYLTITLRTLRKHKGYSFINISGLALGLAACIIMVMFVRDELSYDQFHEKADRIYRIGLDGYPPNSEGNFFAITGPPVGTVLRRDYPEVEHVVRIEEYNPVIRHKNSYHYDDQFYFAEQEFFDVFSFELIEGDKATALSDPMTLVLTESMAQKYFGTTTAVGQNIILNDSLSFAVSGVLKDFPSNSHFSADFLVSYATRLQFQPENDQAWLRLGTYTYVALNQNASYDDFAAKVKTMVTENFGDQLSSMGFKADLIPQAVPDIYLYSQREAEIGPSGDITQVWVFSAVALFVLLIAGINFMNLATARSMGRAREVGVRKVVGSSRGMLIRQFLGESVVMSMIALFVAIGFVAAAMPFFNDLANKQMEFAQLLQPEFLLGLFVVTTFVGLLAGFYPAFMLSAMPSVLVLKGQIRSTRAGRMLRQGLVVFQFAISIALIAGTGIVYNQVEFMRGQDLGFDQEQVLIVDAQGIPGTAMSEQFEVVKEEFGRLASVTDVSASSSIPGRGTSRRLFNAEDLAEEDSRSARVTNIDRDFLQTYKIDIITGRSLSAEFQTDQREGIMVNETAVEYIGWASAEEAIGKTISFGGPNRTVVGVIKDYHQVSLKQTLEPMLFVMNPRSYGYFSLRLDTNDIPSTIAEIESIWAGLFPGFSFESFFLDDDFNRQYQSEDRLMEVFGFFSFLAIMIACLGLFGLAAFTAQQRTKEIGIRKVLGSTAVGIVRLLSKEFTLLVLAALVVSIPITYFTMDVWLETFPYRTDIGFRIFVVSGMGALLIAWVTVSYQAIRAALTNPVNALRSE
ncbi:MAG: ABC transporter permease [Bacteroidetes bacterium]|nr:MAG: ABC transporter permease [Bacteroidota bacterium]